MPHFPPLLVLWQQHIPTLPPLPVLWQQHTPSPTHSGGTTPSQLPPSWAPSTHSRAPDETQLKSLDLSASGRSRRARDEQERTRGAVWTLSGERDGVFLRTGLSSDEIKTEVLVRARRSSGESETEFCWERDGVLVRARRSSAEAREKRNSLRKSVFILFWLLGELFDCRLFFLL